MFGWRRGNTRGGCVIIPCGCLLSPLFVLPAVVLAWLFVL